MFFNPFSNIFKKQDKEKENYLALTITSHQVYALIWNFESEQVHTLGFAHSKYQDIDNLIHQAAVAIDSAAQQAKSDVSQVVFGLSQDWFENGQLSTKTAKLLENISADLELKAQAFVPLSVSLKNLLKTEESASPHAIFCGIFEDLFEVHLVQNDQVFKSVQSQTKPTIEKIEQVIKSLHSKESLPPRIIVFGQKDSHVVKQLADTNLKDLFTQEPKIEFIDEEKLANSVAHAQAADFLGHEIPLTKQTPAEDITKATQSESENLGFVEGEDILEEKPHAQTAVAGEVENITVPQELPEMQQELQKEESRPTKISFLEQIMTLAYLDKINKIFKSPKSPKKIGIAAIFSIAIVLVADVVLAQTITKAQIIIKVSAQSQESNFSAQITKDGASDFDKSEVAGEEIEGNASGSQKSITTGKKKVGNYAKGDVNVFNWTTSETIFASGTTIISKNGIKFKLDADVKVASRSASSPGQSTVSVTAADFGAEGNVNGGTDFSFQQYDELLYSTRNDNAFTQGDEKEVTVVDKSDLNNLEKSLLSSLKDKAIADLKSKSSDKVIGDDAIQTEVVTKIFDKNIDEEASLVNLNMQITAKTIAYDKSQMDEYLAFLANKDAQNNLEAKPENIEILSTSSKMGKEILNLAGKYRANLIPKFDDEALKAQIGGKSVKQTRQIIKEVPQVQDVTVNFTPSFLFGASVPKDKNRVILKIEAVT